MYKYVGPDGKIVYADRPPVAPLPNVQVFSAGVPRAVQAEERGYMTPRKADAPAETPAQQSAAVPGSPTAADARARELAPLLPALRAALGEATLIDRTVDLCISTLPKSYRRYVGAQDTWKERNAAVAGRMATILSDLMPGEDRLRLEQEALDYTGRQLQPVRAVSPGKRIAWCDRKLDEVGQGKNDLAGIPGIQALMQFQPR